MIKLVLIDVSRTLLKDSGSNVGGDFLGKGETYRRIYPKYQSGEITMEDLLKQTFACWKGLKLSDLPAVYERLAFNEGAKEAVKRIKDMGIKTALLSNIPTHLGKLFQKKLGFDYITGTVLEVKGGVFTGKILEFHNDKAGEAMSILKNENISAEEAVSVGDRRDDAEVFKRVSFGVAYNGDDAAKKAAKYKITHFKELVPLLNKISRTEV